MATTKQKKAVKVVVNGGTPTQAMREANYAPSVIRKPYVLTESQGYKDELAKYGLTEELVTAALVNDINAKPTRRVEELKLGADILRMRKQDNPGTLLVLTIPPEKKEQVEKALSDYLNGANR